MSIRIALLKSGESVIADIKIKELISDKNNYVYVFKKPYIVDLAHKD